jgi:hypothetical protein
VGIGLSLDGIVERYLPAVAQVSPAENGCTPWAGCLFSEPLRWWLDPQPGRHG